MEYRNIKCELKDDIRIIQISRPSELNPLDIETLEEIEACLKSESLITVIRGSSRAFSAGADIKNFKGLSPEVAYSFARTGHRIYNYIADYDLPVIAAINGYALGGGFELSLACDFRIGSHDSKLGLTELNLGIIPGWGGTQRLKALAGEQFALYMIATSRILNADEALAHGILLQKSDNPVESALELARSLKEKSKKTLKFVKSLIRTVPDEIFEEEMTLFGKSFEGSNSSEGVEAFLQKRKPVFKE